MIKRFLNKIHNIFRSKITFADGNSKFLDDLFCVYCHKVLLPSSPGIFKEYVKCMHCYQKHGVFVNYYLHSGDDKNFSLIEIWNVDFNIKVFTASTWYPNMRCEIVSRPFRGPYYEGEYPVSWVFPQNSQDIVERYVRLNTFA